MHIGLAREGARDDSHSLGSYEGHAFGLKGLAWSMEQHVCQVNERSCVVFVWSRPQTGRKHDAVVAPLNSQTQRKVQHGSVLTRCHRHRVSLVL